MDSGSAVGSSTDAAHQNRTGANQIGAVENLAYGAPAFGLALLGITFYVYLPKFYVDDLGVSLTVMGLIILGSRVFDAIIDPGIGRWSDRCRSLAGRRRPFIVGGALPLALSFYLLLVPPQLGSTALGVYFGALTFAFFLVWSIVNVPYEALGTELSFDFVERNKIFAVRVAFFIAGTLCASLFPELVKTEGGDSQERFFLIALAYAPLTAALLWGCGYFVRERVQEARSTASPIAGLYRSLRNEPFRILLVAYVVAGFGAALPATLLFFYVEHVLGSSSGGLFLVLYFVVGFATLPMWNSIARRIGKKRAWLASMAVNTGAFFGVLFLSLGQTTWYGALVAISGMGLAGTLILPSSMQADVIDYEEYHTGERSEGEFIGLWSVARKLSEALGAGIAFPILGLAGYEAGKSPEGLTLTLLSLLYAGVPCCCNLIAALIILRYPIDETLHRSMRAEIEKRSRRSVP